MPAGAELIIEGLTRLLPTANKIIALFTPDDEGRLRGGDTPLCPRARQNVLIETGFAMIQRRADSVIIALGNTEIPSDLSGIRTIQATSWDATVENQLAQTLNNM
jgi:predicted nucleotide-binding protein